MPRIEAALDTAAGAALAIRRDGAIILRANLASAGRESDRELGGWLMGEFAKAGVELVAVERWTVGTGPGSFAGLRVGISMVLGICLPGNTPCRGVPSSLALATMVADGVKPGEHIAVLHDARRGQVIYTDYEMTATGLRQGAESAALEIAVVVPLLQAAARLVTPHGPVLLPLLPPELTGRVTAVTQLDAAGLLQASAPWPQTEAESQASCQPVYVRPPVFVAPRPARILE